MFDMQFKFSTIYAVILLLPVFSCKQAVTKKGIDSYYFDIKFVTSNDDAYNLHHTNFISSYYSQTFGGTNHYSYLTFEKEQMMFDSLDKELIYLRYEPNFFYPGDKKFNVIKKYYAIFVKGINLDSIHHRTEKACFISWVNNDKVSGKTFSTDSVSIATTSTKDWFVGGNTIYLESNLPKEKVQELFPFFTGRFNLVKPDSITIDVEQILYKNVLSEFDNVMFHIRK